MSIKLSLLKIQLKFYVLTRNKFNLWPSLQIRCHRVSAQFRACNFSPVLDGRQLTRFECQWDWLYIHVLHKVYLNVQFLDDQVSSNQKFLILTLFLNQSWCDSDCVIFSHPTTKQAQTFASVSSPSPLPPPSLFSTSTIYIRLSIVPG